MSRPKGVGPRRLPVRQAQTTLQSPKLSQRLYEPRRPVERKGRDRSQWIHRRWQEDAATRRTS